MSDLRDLALASNAWPFQEARVLLEQRLKGEKPAKGFVLFETGYGPSGLPHIGTFGEVVRTTMVRRAFELMTGGDIPTRLFAFSDDMDGLRKVPDNIPNKDVVREHLGKPLTRIPDPFGTHESFGHHNNARLRGFLDSFGFEYEFQSASDYYMSGKFDGGLKRVNECYDAIMDVMLPTLGEERRQTYSPFLPVSPTTGRVLQVAILDRDVENGLITFEDEDGTRVTQSIYKGGCKLQWKCDWGMRWYVLGVDYEMSGKDLIPSVELASKICRIMGGTPPQNLTYELFLDDKGQKISKSKGNGLSVEEWLTYAPDESLALYMFQKPKTAKRLYFDVIPKAVDEYLTWCEKFPGQEPKDKLANPAWHIHNGQPPAMKAHLSFGILLNLAGVAHSDDPAVLWHYITRYAPDASPETAPMLDRLVTYAIRYYRDFVLPSKVYRKATEAEVAALKDLRDGLAAVPVEQRTDATELQNIVYAVGKTHADTFPELRAWFQCQYQVLLGQDQGPRMGSFYALYGVDESIALLDKAIAGEDIA